jgi:hypothetical protein
MPPTTTSTTALTITGPAWLRAVLPGTWRVFATTFPLRRGEKSFSRTITYRLLPGEGLRLRHEVGYLTRSGVRGRVSGTDRYDPRTGWFVRRGRCRLWPVRNRWSVEHISCDGELMVIMFGRSAFSPAGMNVLGRGTGARPGLGERLAPVDIGLSGMEFTDLIWLPA